jgi:hypothetical protein
MDTILSVVLASAVIALLYLLGWRWHLRLKAMVQNLTPITQSEMLKDWAIAEASNESRWTDLQKVKPVVPKETLEKVKAGTVNKISEQEWANLVQAIKGFRSPLLAGLLPLVSYWYTGELATNQLKNLRIIKYLPFWEIAPSQEFVEVVKALEQHRHINDAGFLNNVERLKGKFQPSRMLGRPILVSRDAVGPYTVVEGYTRLSVMLLRQLEGTRCESSVTIILGVSERIEEWNWY